MSMNTQRRSEYQKRVGGVDDPVAVDIRAVRPVVVEHYQSKRASKRLQSVLGVYCAVGIHVAGQEIGKADAHVNQRG